MTALPLLPRVLAVVSNDPARAFVWLHALRHQLALDPNAETAGTATVVEGGSLLSKMGREGASLGALLRPSRGRVTLMEVGRVGDVRPLLGDVRAHAGPFRWRGVVAAGAGGPPDADQAAAMQQAHCAELPDEMRRALGGAHEREAFFLRMLTAWQQQRLLDGPAPMTTVLRVLTDSARLASASPRICMMSDGQQVWCHARGMSLHVLAQAGLPEDAAAEVDVSFVDGNSARDRLKRFRGSLVVGGMDEAPAGWQSWGCEANETLALGMATDHRITIER